MAKTIPMFGLLITKLTWNQLKLIQKGLIAFGLSEFAEYMRSRYMIKYCYAGNMNNCASLQTIRLEAIEYSRMSFARFTEKTMKNYFKLNKSQRFLFRPIIDHQKVERLLVKS